jgi:hypothetical protein
VIIFGTSSKVVQLAMLNLLCGFCGNPSAHALRKRVMKFALFFIPLFPIAPAKHSMQCTFCGAVTELSKENAEALLKQNAAGPDGGHGHTQAPGTAPGNPYAGGRPPYRS